MNSEKIGTSGAILAAMVCPACFPALATVGAALGLGGLAVYGHWFSLASQMFLLLALAGHALAWRRHRRPGIPLMAAAGVALVLGSLWYLQVEMLQYAGLLALVAATLWSMRVMRACAACDAKKQPVL